MKKTILTKMVMIVGLVLLGTSIKAQVINWQGGSPIVFDSDIGGTQEVFGTLTLSAANYNFDLSVSGSIPNPTFNTKLFIEGQVIGVTNGNFNHSGNQNTFKIEISRNTSTQDPLPCEEFTVTLNFQDIFNRDVGSSTFTVKVKESLRINHQGIINDGIYGYHQNVYSHLLGCGDVNIKTNGICVNDVPPILMMVTEATYNPVSLDITPIPSTEVKRALSTSEKQDLIGLGFEFNSFSNPTKSITLMPNTYYLVTVVNVRNGGWVPTYKYFHIKPGTHDYVMGDFFKDNGVEPSDKWDDNIFKSFDLWNNIPNYGISSNHRDPDYVTPPFTKGNLMRFNLRNLGCNTAAPTAPHELRLFWTRARTDELWDEHWKFSATNQVTSAINFPNKVPAGSEITIASATAGNPYNANSQPLVLQNIPQYAYYLNQVGTAGTQVEWFPPNPLDFSATNGSMSNAGNRPVICFLAVINDKANADDPLIWEPNSGTPSLPNIPIYTYVKNNNNVVTRNSILIEDDINQLVDRGNDDWDYGWGTVWVNNPQGTTRDVTLCLDWDDVGLPNDFSNYGYIEIGLTNGLWSSWVNSGMYEENLTIVSPTLFRLDSSYGCLENIPVSPGSEEQIGVRFVFEGSAVLPDTLESHDYILSAIYDESHQGCNSVFEVHVPTYNPLQTQNKKDPNIKKVDETASDLIVYPNPAKGVFLMSASLAQESSYTISISDIQGSKIKQISGINATKYFTYTFDMKGQRAGVYYITLQSGDTILTKRIVLID